MDLERTLLSKVVFTGEIEKPLSRNITPEHFADDECRKMYEYLVQSTRKYKRCPSLEAAKHDKPDFEWIQVQDSVDYLIDRFTVLVKRRLANEMLLDVAAASDDPDRAENIDLEFLEAAHRLITTIPSGQVERFSQVEKRIRAYEERVKLGRKLGVPYGFPTFDRLTAGIFQHELVSVLGFTNVGKSTLLRVLAFNFWMAGYTPLYFSLEMEAESILHSFDAMAANLDYARLKQLQLDACQMVNWRGLIERFKRNTADIPIIDSLYRVTPDQVYAETLRHKPDVVIVDYVGLMKSSWANRSAKRYDQLTEITQDLKINARMLRVPIIMAAQTNRDGAKQGGELENVANSISISQDSDTVIGLFQDDEMEAHKEMELRLSKSRLGPRGKLKAIWDHDTQTFRERTVGDMFNRHGGDASPARLGVNGNKWMENQISGFARV